MRRKIRTILAISLIAVLLLSGCRLFKKNVHTVISLTSAALTNIGEAESAEVKIVSSGDLTATYEVLNIGMNMKIGSDMDMQMTKDPERAKGTVDLTIGAIGQEQVIDGVMYRDTADDGTKTTYIQWQDGKWLKQTTSPSGEAAAEKKNGITVPSSLIQIVGIMKAIAEEKVTAELKEETATVNDKEAWQMSCVLTGEFLKEIMDMGGLSLGSVSLDSADIDWANIEIPAEIYIYKETELPARITMDCTPIGAPIIESMFADYMDSISLDGIRLDVTSYSMDITFDKYNEIEAFEIPAEAAGASEAESLMPTLTDVLKFW